MTTTENTPKTPPQEQQRAYGRRQQQQPPARHFHIYFRNSIDTEHFISHESVSTCPSDRAVVAVNLPRQLSSRHFNLWHHHYLGEHAPSVARVRALNAHHQTFELRGEGGGGGGGGGGKAARRAITFYDQ